MYKFFCISGISLLLYSCLPLVAVLHELGHAAAARLLTRQPVTVFIGSYGNPHGGLTLALGRSRLHLSCNPLRWARGLCRYAPNVSVGARALIILMGPVLPVLVTAALAHWILRADSPGLLRLWSGLLLLAAALSMLQNLFPRAEPITLFDGAVTYNDGAQMQALWRMRHLPRPYLQALADYTAARYATAAPVLLGYLDQPPQQETTIRLALSALLMAHEYEQAYTVYRAHGHRYVPTADDHTNHGLLLGRRHHFDEALTCYNAALDLNPTHTLALNNRGYTYGQAGRFAEAEADFRQALLQQPDFAYAHANLGWALVMLDQSEEGLSHIQRSLVLDAGNSYAYRNLGLYHLRRHEPAAAAAQFDRAWELDPHTDLLADYRAEAQARLAALAG